MTKSTPQHAAAVGLAPPVPRSHLRTFARWGLALLAVAFVLWVVPFRDRCGEAGCQPGLITTLRGANPLFLLLAFAAYLGSTLVWSMRWRALLRLANVELTVMQAWRLTLEAQTGGILLPGGLGGDALRVAYVRERAPRAELAKVIASIFVDRVVGLVTLAGLATLIAIVSRSSEPGPALYIVAAIPLAATLGFVSLRVPALRRSRLLSGRLAARLLKPMLEYAADERGPRVIGHGLLLSLAVSAFQLVVIRTLVAALGATPTNEPWVYVGTTFGMIVGALPATPGAWGTADAAYVVFLGRAGVAAQVAAAVCLVYRIFWYATGILGAISALGRRKR